jgi:hypothetical protein
MAVLEHPEEVALRAVDLAEPLVFGAGVASDLRLLWDLRESTSHAVRLRWRLAGQPVVPLHTHQHLVPPVDGVDERSREYARRWAARHRYGDFYYRHGPDFVTVRDVRSGRQHSRLVISDGAAEFLAMVGATTVAELAPAARRSVPDAVSAGLALTGDGGLLVLPYRMRHWPVPVDAV